MLLTRRLGQHDNPVLGLLGPINRPPVAKLVFHQLSPESEPL